MKRPVDELRTARSLKRLEEHRRAHPEAFDPSRLPRTPTALARALDEALAAHPPIKAQGASRIGRPPSDDPSIAVTSRLPRSLLARLDAARGDRNRGEVVREAIERWLRAERRRK